MPAPGGGLAAESKRQPHGHKRDDYGENKTERATIAERASAHPRKLHRFHADVMHCGNARTHQRLSPKMAVFMASVFRLTTSNATAEADTAAIMERRTVGQSYCTGTGRINASMPT